MNICKPNTLGDQYIRKEFSILGAKVSAVFPKEAKHNDIMATVKEMLVHSHVNTCNNAENGTVIKHII